MIGQRMQDALNDQINAEYYSSYLYLSMAAHSEAINQKGFANWFRVQAQEEMVHAMKIFDFVLERGGQVTLKAIEGPPTAWDSPQAVLLYAAADQAEHREFSEQLTAERQVATWSEGRGEVVTWERIRRQNHYLDAAYSALAAGDLFLALAVQTVVYDGPEFEPGIVTV